jgi:hypothetical protein
MAALGTIGFVKDAKSHIDIQGFNIYHKNRLIKVCFSVHVNFTIFSLIVLFDMQIYSLSAILEDMESCRQ